MSAAGPETGESGSVVDDLVADGAALLDVLFDQTPMGVAVFDRDLVLRTCNETWARFARRHGTVEGGRVVAGRAASSTTSRAPSR